MITAKLWHFPLLKKELQETIRNDRKNLKNISVYYEFHHEQDQIQAIDGHHLFQLQKQLYEMQGMVLMKEQKDVVIEGEKLKMLIFRFTDESTISHDYFGGLAGYLQASCERVLYMKRY